MHKNFKKLISTFALTMSFLLCSNTTLAFASANSLSIGNNSKENTARAGYTVNILHEDAKTRIAKSVDAKEVTLVSFDKITQQSKMIILPLNADTKKGSNQDFINLFKTSSSSLSDEVSQKFELKSNPEYNTNKNISIQSLSNQSVNLFFSDLSYAYFGQYSLTNTKNSNVRIAGSDVQKDGCLIYRS